MTLMALGPRERTVQHTTLLPQLPAQGLLYNRHSASTGDLTAAQKSGSLLPGPRVPAPRLQYLFPCPSQAPSGSGYFLLRRSHRLNSPLSQPSCAKANKP